MTSINGKVILTLVISLNIVMLLVVFGCGHASASCGSSFGSGIISTLFNLDVDTDLSQSGGFDTSENLETAVKDATSATGGGGGVGSVIAVFLDGLKMVLGVIVLLTPLPILDLFFTFGFPLYIVIVILPLVFILYVVSIIEFIKGAEF